MTRFLAASRCFGFASITSSSLAERDRLQPASARLERQDAEVEAALEQLASAICRDATRRTSTARLRMQPREPLDDRQEAWTAASLAPMTTRPRRTCWSSRTAASASDGEPQEPLRRVAAAGPPASVSAPLRDDRSNSRSPSSSSRRRIAWLIAGWVRCSRLAAFEKLRSAATATKALRSWSCTAYHKNYSYKVKNYKLDVGRPDGYKCQQEDPCPRNRLTIFDTTLRDGEQAPGFSMRIDEKLKLARQLAALGVDIIEAGFPIASEADAEAVRTIATHVDGPIIAGLARCSPADIDRAGVGARPRAAAAASTSSSPPPICTSSASCA